MTIRLAALLALVLALFGCKGQPEAGGAKLLAPYNPYPQNLAITDAGAGFYATPNAVAVTAPPFNATCNGTSDDGPAITACLNATAGTGTACWLPACTANYAIRSVVVVPNNSIIMGSPGAVLQSTMAPVGSQTNDIFRAKPTYTGNNGSLYAVPAIGATSIQVTGMSKPTVGDWYQLGYSTAGAGTVLTAQQFLAKSVSGGQADAGGACNSSNPCTIGLDRPVVYAFTTNSNTSVEEESAIPQNLEVRGNKMVLTGTGDRAIEFWGCWGCLIEDVYQNGSGGTFSDTAMSIDVGSRLGMILRSQVDMSGTPGSQVYGISIEGNEGSVVIDSRAKGAIGGANFLLDGYGNYQINCYDENGGATYGFAYGQGSGLGAISSGNIGGVATSGQGYYLQIATNVSLTNVAAIGSGTGVDVSTSSTGAIIDGFTYVGNASTTSAIQLSADAIVDKFNISGVATAANEINITGGTHAFLRNGVMSNYAGGNAINAESTFTGQLDVQDVQIGLAASAYSILVQGTGASATINGVVLTGSASGSIGLYTTSGTTANLGFGNSFSAAATPYSIGGSGGALSLLGTLGGVSGANALASCENGQALTTGTTNLASTVYNCPKIKFTGSLSGAVTVVFPSTAGACWDADFSAITFNSHSITLQANSNNWGTTVSSSAVEHVCYQDGPGKIYGAAMTP